MTRSLLPLLVVLVGAIGPAIAGSLLYRQRRLAHKRRRSPLTSDLLRPPGYGVRVQIEALRDRVDELFVMLVAGPLILFSVHLTQSHFFGAQESITRTLLVGVAAAAVVTWTVSRLLKLSRRLHRLRLGLDAEMAVGQELDQLMKNGAVVFHDVPAEKFNIDHLVIAPSGVFAVETKGRSKPLRGRGSEDAEVVFDGEALQFPGWKETEPLSQAKRQAKWVGEWLSRAVGASVAVTPVLAIPGWYIKATGRSQVRVINGKKPQFLLRLPGVRLGPEMIERISYQVEQRCRTVRHAYLELK